MRRCATQAQERLRTPRGSRGRGLGQPRPRAVARSPRPTADRRRRRRRSRRGEENRPRSGEEAETKHSTAARRRRSARPRSTPRAAGPAEGVRGPAAARGGRGGQRSARTAAGGQGARVGAAPPRRPGRADAARPHPHLRGPDLRRGRHETAGGRRGGRRGAAEVAAAPGTAGTGPGRPSCRCAAGRRRPSRCLCCCAALGTADPPLRPPGRPAPGPRQARPHQSVASRARGRPARGCHQRT